MPTGKVCKYSINYEIYICAPLLMPPRSPRKDEPLKLTIQEELRWRRNRTGRPFLPYKFIERTFEHWANCTKQLLIASRGHHTPRKAAHHLRKEVGQNIKDNKRDKRARDGDPSQEGSCNRRSFQTPGNPLTCESGGSFRILEGNLTGRKN